MIMMREPPVAEKVVVDVWRVLAPEGILNVFIRVDVQKGNGKK